MIKISNIETYFDVQNSKPVFDDRNKLSELFKTLIDGRYTIHIKRVVNIRSKEQNNAMWGIPYMYFKRSLEETGNFKNPSDENVHQFCMHHCLPEDYKERILKEWKDTESMIDVTTGELFKPAFRLTTTKMKTTDSMNYYSNMQQFYAEYFSSGEEKDVIPNPKKNWKEDSKEENV